MYTYMIDWNFHEDKIMHVRILHTHLYAAANGRRLVVLHGPSYFCRRWGGRRERIRGLPTYCTLFTSEKSLCIKNSPDSSPTTLRVQRHNVIEINTILQFCIPQDFQNVTLSGIIFTRLSIYLRVYTSCKFKKIWFATHINIISIIMVCFYFCIFNS